MCGAWAVEVVVGSGGGATAKLLCVDRGLSETVRSTLDLICEVFDASLYIKSIVPAILVILESLVSCTGSTHLHLEG